MTDTHRYEALLVDFGGVLTTSVARSFRASEERLGLPKGTVSEIVAAVYAGDGRDGMARFETGQASPQEFEAMLGEAFAERGFEVAVDGLSRTLFTGTSLDEDTWALVDAVHDAGYRTGLLSNSWGLDVYPRERLATTFDDIVISGEVGMRKPDAEIFRLAADRLDVELERCVFLDDFHHNIEAAEALGITALLHRDAATTGPRLQELFGVAVPIS